MLDRKAPLHLWKHLSSFSKMCFVSGPRQSGKTTFVQNIIQPQYHISQYHNWDNHEDKLQLLNDPYWFQKKDNIHNKATCLIFDEIHKYPDWKNYLKGVYDSFHTTHDIIVSGSGRLDIFQKAGDSLAGRYLLMNLYPLTFIDFVDPNSIEPLFLKPFQTMYNKDNIEIWKNFMTFGSFPEMFAKQSESFSRLWSANYTKQLIFEDIRDMTALRNMAKLDILFQLLVSKVANPLSINNIAQSLGVQFQTAQQWIEVIEHYFLVFQITPWSKNLNRSIRKEKKCYLMDIFHLKNQSIRFENLIALELLARTTWLTQMGYANYTLHYLRDRDGREVDFLIACDNEPRLLIEAKLHDTNVSKSLLFYQKKLKLPGIQIVNKPKTRRIIKNDTLTTLVTDTSWFAGAV